MKLNIKVQYGLLLCLHLTRKGKASASVAAKELGLSPTFLTQVATKLAKGGVLTAVKGNGGGYQLSDSPTVRDIFHALGVSCTFLTYKEQAKYRLASDPFRALLCFSTSAQRAIDELLDRKIRGVGNDLLLADLDAMQTPVGGIS